MAELNLTYYTEKDCYSDGDIEDVMLEMAQKGISYEQLPEDEVSFPIIYHFSPMRENILNWYPFEKDACILEIGAGCGAITGMLCRRAAKVVAVELSKRRAMVNYARHKDADNLCIMVGNLNDMELPAQFDYVILNGVLEYALSFTGGATPYETFLGNMGRFLREDGRFLIAIENRLGMKYFAGAPEDHTDRFFLGLNNYDGEDSVRTFSKTELSRLLDRCGYSCVKYYYPYPDYKFAKEIFTDETLKSNGFGKPYRSMTGKNMPLFSESQVLYTLVEEGVADVFANSFLVEAGRTQKQCAEEILYVKSNSERKEEFQILTKILRRDGQKLVRKEPLRNEAVPFVKKMIENGKVSYGNGYENLPARERDGALEYPFIEGDTMFDKIRHFAANRDKEAIIQQLQKFYDTCFADKKDTADFENETFLKMFGRRGLHKVYACVCPANLDLISDNVYLDEEKKQVIDYEWVLDTPVPADFIMWRLLDGLYIKLPQLRQIFADETLFDIFHISGEDERIYRKWSQYFVYHYVGADALDKYLRPELPVNMENIYRHIHRKEFMESKLYLDTGKGFNENEIITAKVPVKNRRFCVTFDLTEKKEVKELRWDPMEESCWCSIDRVRCNCGVRLWPQSPGWRGEAGDIFPTADPNYQIEVFDAGEIRKLVIEGRYDTLSEEQLTRLKSAEEKR